jgi:hypothetical protein
MSLITRIAMTVDVSYLPHWGIKEGLRELFQNMIDASTDSGQDFRVEYTGTTLKLTNPGSSMDRDALLVGATTKRDRDDQMGKWGEGLKFGAQAIVRPDLAGKTRSVVVRVNDETWSAKVMESPEFPGRDVLTWIITKSPHQDAVSVSVSPPVSPAEYREVRDLFLRFQTVQRKIATWAGTVLLESKFAGKVYVKGIFVCQDENLKYGYNLTDADLDRDRRMVSQYDLARNLSSVWRVAVTDDPSHARKLLTMLADGCKDVEQVRWWNSGAKEAIISAFRSQYGEGVPVDSQEAASQLGHYGKRGIIVSKDLLKFLSGEITSADEVMKSIGESPREVFELDSLDDNEMENLLWAAGEVEQVLGIDVLARTSVVDFHGEDLLGMWRGSMRAVEVARKLLTDRFRTLEVLVHEFAHDYGRDGTKEHVAKIESIWREMLRLSHKVQ